MRPNDLRALSVQDVLDRWPDTVGVFIRRRMNCPGCAMARLMTVAEAAAIYDVPAAGLIADLLVVIGAATGGRAR